VVLILTEAQLSQMIAHAHAEAPNEACGLLAGIGDQVIQVLPAVNIAEDATVRYLMDPHDQLRLFQAMEEQGLELLGIYHSHPSSPAYPSPTDLSMAYYPEAAYAIVSLLSGDRPMVRAFRIRDGQIVELDLSLAPTEPDIFRSSRLFV